MTDCRNEKCEIRTGTTGELCHWCARLRCECGEVLHSQIDRELEECHACRDGVPQIVGDDDE